MCVETLGFLEQCFIHKGAVPSSPALTLAVPRDVQGDLERILHWQKEKAFLKVNRHHHSLFFTDLNVTMFFVWARGKLVCHIHQHFRY